MTAYASSAVVRREQIPGARSWSFELRRGYALRLTDETGGANCSALFYNARHLLERYNMADTLKAQYTAFLTRGHCCYSDMGRILVSIVEDSCGWHDAFCGVSGPDEVAAKYGESRYQHARNAWYRSGRDSLLKELGKWGMGLSDLDATVNFFSKVMPDENGELHFVSDHSPAGSTVVLRAEMDVVVVLDTCPHPLDPAPEWAPKAVLCEVIEVPVAPDWDPCRLSRPENARGYANNALYHCQCHDHGSAR